MPFVRTLLPHLGSAALVAAVGLVLLAVFELRGVAAVLTVGSLCALLLAAGEIVLFLTRARRRERARHLREEQALRTDMERLANQNAEISNLLFRTVDRLQILSSIDQDLAERTLDLDALLKSLARRTSACIGDVVGVYLLEEHQPALRALEANGASADGLKELFVAEPAWEVPTLVRLALKTGQTRVYADLQGTAAALGTARETAVYRGHPQLRHGLAAPIHGRSGDQVGALLVLRTGTGGSAFTQDDIELLEQVADRAATAIENARLYRARETFLGLAAHELRTPTTALRAQAQLMLRRLESLPADRLRNGLENIERQTGKLARLINDLLDVTRIEAAKLELRQERVDGGALATELVERFEQVTSRRCFRREGPARAEVLADPVRLDQILSNLLGNAVKFCQDGEIILSVERQGAEWIFSVIDHGPGIPRDKQGLIFERFSQLGSDGDRRGGLGLGLYLSRELVLRMGGRIWIESDGTPGHRTAFRIALPALEPVASNVVRAPEASVQPAAAPQRRA